MAPPMKPQPRRGAEQTQVAAQTPDIEYGRNPKGRCQLVGPNSIDFGGIAEWTGLPPRAREQHAGGGGLHDCTSITTASEEGLDESSHPS